MIRYRKNSIMLVIDKRRWLTMFLSVITLCVLIEPAYISQTMNTVHQVFRILKGAIVILVLASFTIYRMKVSMLLVWAGLFEFSLFISTLLNGADIIGWAKDGAYSVVLLLFMQMVFMVSPDLLFKSLSIVLGAYVHINTLTWILYPKGLYVHTLGYHDCWFLGYDNVGAIIIILAQIIALYRMFSSREKHFRLWDLSILISGGVFVFSRMMAAAIIAETVIALFLLLTRNERIRNIRGKATIVSYGALVLFVLIQFFGVQNRGVFPLILSLLGKSTAFSGRAVVWKEAWLEIFTKNLFLGRGIQTAEDIAVHFGRRIWVHLHNYYLQVIYEGGLLAFLLLVVLLLRSSHHFDSKKTTFCDMILLAGYLAMLIIWQVEAYSYVIRYFYIFLFLLYNAHEFKPARDMPKTS